MPTLNSRPPRLRLAVLLASLVLSHEARNTIRIMNSHGRVAESKRRTATSLRVICRLELLKSSAVGEIICEGDIGWQVGAGGERAGALAAIELGHESVLVNPVGAGEWAGQAGSDAVAGAVDTVLVVEVDFGNDS